MNGPLQPGTTDGQLTNHDGRPWTWVVARQLWFPSEPSPYEMLTSANGQRWMYHPVLEDWFDPLDFPDETEPDGASSAGAVVREAVDDPGP